MGQSWAHILSGYDEVRPFIEAVSEASDAHRDQLGFFPRGAFEEFARTNDLYVLVIRDGENYVYAGHLLFARRYPRAKVLQLLVLAMYRGQKYARLLCDRLIESLTSEGFTSIYARVGEDMREANDAWQAMGFRVQRTVPGGATTGRTIVVRARELAGPQLFPTQNVDLSDPLGLARNLSAEAPLFLLDLNVLFDLSPHRARHQDALTLFQAERSNFCKLAISDEIFAELTRTHLSERPDPMMNLARTFSRFPVSETTIQTPVVIELAKIIFPNKAAESLSCNDISDLRHLVTAIENRLDGLITNDGASLRAAQGIERQFGVQVLSPRAFVPEGLTGTSQTTYETKALNLELRLVSDKIEADIRRLLAAVGVTATDIASGWLSPLSSSFAVYSGMTPIGYMSWPALKRDKTTMIRAAVDESVSGTTEAARGLLIHAMNINVTGPTVITLRTAPGQVVLRDIARGLGFCGAGGATELTKLAFGLVATKSNWSRRRSELAEISGLKMDAQFPLYRRFEQQIPYVTKGGDHGHETLERLETLLSPALFCFPGRPAVITPIRHEYAKLLLGHSRQGSLLPAPASNLFQEKHFISGPNAFGQLKRGTLMFFYESDPPRGQGELVAVARVRRSYRKDSAALAEADLGRSVLSEDSIDDIGRAKVKTVTVFDNLFSLPSTVSLRRLQQIGCGQPHDLITTRGISDTQIQIILAEAFRE